jgi:tetratricopeptide (TPR) repeat protein
VIAAQARGDDTIRYLAAESHANLGFIALPRAGTASGERETRYRQAEDDYRRAIALSDGHPARKAFFFSRVGFIAARLGQPDTAEEAFDMAASLDPTNAELYRGQLQQALASASQ